MRARQEPWSATWRRRAISIPLVFLGGTIVVAAMPLTLLAGVAMAPFERRRFSALRCVGFFTTYLAGEMGFLALAFAQWIASVPFTRASADRLERWTEWLGNRWGTTLHAAGQRFFALRIEVSGLDALERGGPLIVLMRHASMGDTPLAPVYVGRHAGLRLRYVAKRELRSDPIFDVIGGRIRSWFVERESTHAAREIEGVSALVDDLGPRDAIVLYPEGTRFSTAKRERVLARLAEVDPALHARARHLAHVLPPRLGGPIALLERNRGADVVFCAHAGYEAAASFGDLLSGRAIGQRIQVGFRRVPFRDIPTGRAALIDWLFDEWQQVDRWIDERSPRPAHEAAPAPSRRQA